MLCRDYKGDLVESPKDLKTTIASFADNYIIWSCNGKKHRVRYGLQTKEFPKDKWVSAAKEFAYCVMHCEASQ